MENVSSPLVKALEQTWTAIQRRHEDVPEVVVTLASGSISRGMKLGHFAADRWLRGEVAIHELFIGGEGLARGGVGTLGTLLHEAAHAAAAARGIQDISRQGRYHNKRFKTLAESFGLTLEHSASIGWSTTTVPDATAAAYASEIRRLDTAITAHRRAEATGPGGSTRSNNGKAAECSCGRKIRASLTVLDAGPIICGLCGSEFTAES